MSELALHMRVLILGAAGHDLHNFYVVYRADPRVEVLTVTAAQIPELEGCRYPSALSRPLYPAGIPIVPESELDSLVRERQMGHVVFAYSDVTHAQVMRGASSVLAMMSAAAEQRKCFR